MSYRGDSDGKRLARANLWMHVFFDAKAPLPTRERPAVVLASREGGDVRALRAFGAEPEAIVAVDLDPDALAECERRLPGAARYEHGDVADVLDRLDLRPSVVHLDFCAQLCRGVADTTARVSRRLDPGDLLALTVLRGREYPGSELTFRLPPPIEPTMSRRERRAAKALLRTRKGQAIKDEVWREYERETNSTVRYLGDRLVIDLHAAVSLAVSRCSDKLTRSSNARVEVARTVVDAANLNRRTRFYTLAVFAYCSSSPMTEALLVAAHQDEPAPTAFVEVLPNHSRRKVAEHILSGTPPVSSTFVADLLNLPPAQVAAWKAVQSRKRNQSP